MKKILIAVAYMNSAGTEKAMLNFINALPKERIEITVLLISARLGVWQDKIPKYCKVVEVDIDEKSKYNAVFGVKEAIFRNLKKGRVFKAFSLFFKRVFKKNMMPQVELDWHDIPSIDENYDLAICYMGHNPFLVKYIAYKVSANKKCMFIHSSFSSASYRLDFCEGLEKYNYFYGVSKQLKAELEKFLDPKKVKLFHNFVPVNEIKLKADENGDVFNEYNGIKLLTIGRLSSEKGIDIAIGTMFLLKKKFANLKWYVIGGGPLEKKLKHKVKRLKLKKDFIFLGIQDNPYKFLNKCDIYIQPSRYEGYSTTVNEARVLCKPIIATDVSGTSEMLVDGENGFIAAINKKAILTAILKILRDNNIKQKFVDNLKSIDFSNKVNLNDFFADNL